MKDRVFVDTNVLIYASTDNDKLKQARALSFLRNCIGIETFISTQVLSEFYSAMRKNYVDAALTKRYLESYAQSMNVLPVTKEIVMSCMGLIGKYGYSIWDGLIIASALSVGCSMLCSEDMSHNQVINSQLRIHNPFM